SLVEGLHRHLQSLSGGADNIGSGHLHVLEGDAAIVSASLTHVDLLLSDTNAGSLRVDNKGCECLSSGSLRVGVRSSQNENPVSDSCIGDPHLGSVDDVLVALLD
ncbi:hypothetical protein PMAYCL1PPCAC_26590, partial [Pristionchus mayeri]